MSNMKLMLSVVILLPGSQSAVLAAPAEQPPNILLIITDQQFAEAMSCAGNPNAQTPAIDGLAARGMRVAESYCTSPVCAPSRSSILTGLFPHQHGVTENGKRIRSDLKEICIENLLADKGYECVYAGKWHLAASRTIGQTELQQHPYRVLADSNDARVSDACVQYLGEEHKRPFFLVASYINPHDICLWAMGKQEGYQKYPVPEIPLDQCPPLPTNYAISGDEPGVLRDYYMSRHFEYETFNEERWQRYLHAYYWMVEAVDAEIGRLLDAVHANELEENTLVVFTSDHGDGLAAHQWLGKCTHYEEATRVPFVVSFPGVIAPGRVDRTHLVSNGPDFYATALDYAGVTIPNGCHGRSLRRLLEGTGGSDSWRDQVVSEIWVPGNNPGRGESWK
jgi:arylsulfatase A-like enzyme